MTIITQKMKDDSKGKTIDQFKASDFSNWASINVDGKELKYDTATKQLYIGDGISEVILSKVVNAVKGVDGNFNEFLGIIMDNDTTDITLKADQYRAGRLNIISDNDTTASKNVKIEISGGGNGVTILNDNDVIAAGKVTQANSNIGMNTEILNNSVKCNIVMSGSQDVGTAASRITVAESGISGLNIFNKCTIDNGSEGNLSGEDTFEQNTYTDIEGTLGNSKPPLKGMVTDPDNVFEANNVDPGFKLKQMNDNNQVNLNATFKIRNKANGVAASDLEQKIVVNSTGGSANTSISTDSGNYRDNANVTDTTNATVNHQGAVKNLGGLANASVNKTTASGGSGDWDGTYTMREALDALNWYMEDYNRINANKFHVLKVGGYLSDHPESKIASVVEMGSTGGHAYFKVVLENGKEYIPQVPAGGGFAVVYANMTLILGPARGVINTAINFADNPDEESYTSLDLEAAQQQYQQSAGGSSAGAPPPREDSAANNGVLPFQRDSVARPEGQSRPDSNDGANAASANAQNSYSSFFSGFATVVNGSDVQAADAASGVEDVSAAGNVAAAGTVAAVAQTAAVMPVSTAASVSRVSAARPGADAAAGQAANTTATSVPDGSAFTQAALIRDLLWRLIQRFWNFGS